MSRLATYLVLLGVCSLLAGCPSASTPITQDARYITYSLPRTEAVVIYTLDLHECTDTDFTVAASLKILKSAVPDPGEVYQINAKNLVSLTDDLDMKIALHSNGAIKSINSTASDKTFSIVGNLLKTAATIGALGVSMVPEASGTATGCAQTVHDSLGQRDTLKADIEQLREKLLKAKPQEVEGIRQKIDEYANEVARLNTEVLRITLRKTLDLSQLAGSSTVKWQAKDFKKWTGSDETSFVEQIVFKATLADATPQLASERVPTVSEADADSVESNYKANQGNTVALCPSDPACERTLVFRDPMPVKVTIRAVGSNVVRKTGDGPADKVLEETIYVPQFSKKSYLSLSAALAESSTFSMDLDEFGRRTSLGFKSQARADAVLSGIASSAEQYAAYRTARKGTTPLEDAQARLLELDTQLKLNKLLYCEEVILAGGFTCPE